MEYDWHAVQQPASGVNGGVISPSKEAPMTRVLLGVLGVLGACCCCCCSESCLKLLDMIDSNGETSPSSSLASASVDIAVEEAGGDIGANHGCELLALSYPPSSPEEA